MDDLTGILGASGLLDPKLLTSVTALLVAGLALLKASRVSRIQAVSSEEIARVEAEASIATARLKEAAETARAESELAIASMRERRQLRASELVEARRATEQLGKELKNAWEQIQVAKEELAKLFGPARQDLDLTLEALSAVHEEVKEIFARIGPDLDPAARKALHQAKGLMAQLSLTGAEEADLRTNHLSLTEYQHRLVEERQRLVEAHFRRSLKLLEEDSTR